MKHDILENIEDPIIYLSELLLGEHEGKDLTTSFYHRSFEPYMKYRFDGLENIEHNYSQAYQDMFVLSILNGKKNGTFLEIGSNCPHKHNNTYLLESVFGWTGCAIEYDPYYVDKYNEARSARCIEMDAREANFTNIINNNITESDTIDYLQVDCDPHDVSLDILERIPFADYKFNVITFEHDLYACNGEEYGASYTKSAAYSLLASDYLRVINNVSTDYINPFEDWWIHKHVISSAHRTSLIDERINNGDLLCGDDIKRVPDIFIDIPRLITAVGEESILGGDVEESSETYGNSFQKNGLRK